MKCREAQHWLYSFRPNTSWPVELVGHMQECAKCQTLHVQLNQIDAGVGKLTSGAGDPSAKQQLLTRIAQTPQVGAPADTTPKAELPWLRWGAYLSGAAALIALGFLVGRFTDPAVVPTPGPSVKFVETVREKVVEKFRDRLVHVPIHSQADRDLFAALLKHNSLLVQATQPGDRLELLLDMADDCRLHALLLIEDGPRDTLPMTIELYAQLLREGVLGQVVQAPMAARPALQMTARKRLEKMAELPAADPKTLSVVLADQRDALQQAARQTMGHVDHPEDAPRPAKTRKLQPTEVMAPTTALVQFALAASSETDPVVKADLCADYVQRLMPTMRLYLADDSVPERDQMGQQLGELLQHGVYVPLELAAAKEPEPPVQSQAARIIENAAQAIAEMQKDLDQAPTGARQGWEKALEASKKGFEKSQSSSKGKGPREIHGLLKNIDAAKGTITVYAKVKGKDGDHTYALTREILSLLTTRSTWKVGFAVQLRLSDDRRTVIDIQPGKGSNDDGQKNQK